MLYKIRRSDIMQIEYIYKVHTCFRFHLSSGNQAWIESLLLFNKHRLHTGLKINWACGLGKVTVMIHGGPSERQKD